MTLSLFPSLLDWSMLSPFILRLALGSVFIFWAYRGILAHRTTPRAKAIGLVEGIAGILLIIGLWTQGAALVAIIDLTVRIVQKINARKFLTDGVNYYALLLAIALSLIVTGAGAFAFDLPL